MRNRILLIEDNIELNEVIVDYLTNEGLDVFCVSTLKAAINKLSEQAFDLIILDINLPDGDGRGFLREFREVSSVPVIFASARGNENDRILGFTSGGDDYLPKPYSLAELAVRVKALLRRSYGKSEAVLVRSGIVLDTGKGLVTVHGEEIKLSPKELDLLHYFMLYPNRVLSKEMLINAVWGAYSEVEQATLAVHVRWLREKIEPDPSRPQILETVWGRGYRFVCQEETY